MCPGLQHSPKSQSFHLHTGRKRWSFDLHFRSCHSNTCDCGRYKKLNRLYLLLVFLKGHVTYFLHVQISASSSDFIFVSSWYLLEVLNKPPCSIPKIFIFFIFCQVFSLTVCICMTWGWLHFNTVCLGWCSKVEQGTTSRNMLLKDPKGEHTCALVTYLF